MKTKFAFLVTFCTLCLLLEAAAQETARGKVKSGVGAEADARKAVVAGNRKSGSSVAVATASSSSMAASGGESDPRATAAEQPAGDKDDEEDRPNTRPYAMASEEAPTSGGRYEAKTNRRAKEVRTRGPARVGSGWRRGEEGEEDCEDEEDYEARGHFDDAFGRPWRQMGRLMGDMFEHMQGLASGGK